MLLPIHGAEQGMSMKSVTDVTPPYDYCFRLMWFVQPQECFDVPYNTFLLVTDSCGTIQETKALNQFISANWHERSNGDYYHHVVQTTLHWM